MRCLGYMQMRVQLAFFQMLDFGKRIQADEHLVANAATFQQHISRTLKRKISNEIANHAGRGEVGVRSRGLNKVRNYTCRKGIGLGEKNQPQS